MPPILASRSRIDEAVVDRRDQDIGAGNGVAGQRIVGAGAIEDDIVVRRGQPVDQGVGLAAFRVPLRLAAGDAVMLRQLQAQSLAPGEIAPVLDIAGERALVAVEIDARHGIAPAQQGDDQMHRRGRFAGPALLVAEHDDRAGAAAAVCRLTRSRVVRPRHRRRGHAGMHRGSACRQVVHTVLSVSVRPGFRATSGPPRLAPE